MKAKRVIAFLMLVAAAAGTAEARYVWEGLSFHTNATTVPAEFVIPNNNHAYVVNIIVLGTNAVFASKMATAAPIVGFSSAQAMMIPGTATYTTESGSNERMGRIIRGVTFATTNGTSEIIITFE